MSERPIQWKRTPKWVLWNAAIFAAVWFGVVEGVGWVENLARFGLPALALIGGLGLAFCLVVILLSHVGEAWDDDLEEMARKLSARSVPTWLNRLTDVALVVILAAFGWYWIAALWTAACIWGGVGRALITGVLKSREAVEEATP